MKFFFSAIFFLLTMFECDFETLMGKQTSRWRFVSTREDQLVLERYKELYERNQQLQFTTEGPYKIPNEIHLIWLGPRPFPSESVENIRTWIAHHPEWTFHLWSDRPRPPPVKGIIVHEEKEFPLKRLKKLFYESTNWGQKSDLLRYEILSQRGGIYIDHDANSLRSFDGLHRGYDFYTCLEVPHTRVGGRSITSGIGIIGSCKNHPIIEECIEDILAHWEETVENFPTSSPEALRDYVMHSTYLPFTRSLEKNLTSGDFVNIVFPASYFYPQKSLKPIYSFHGYGTSWAAIENESILERSIRLNYVQILKKQRTIMLAVIGTIALILFALWRHK